MAKPRQGHTLTFHTYTPQPLYQISTSSTLQFLRYSPNKMLKVKVNTLRSPFDVVQLHPQSNVLSKYQIQNSCTLQFLRYFQLHPPPPPPPPPPTNVPIEYQHLVTSGVLGYRLDKLFPATHPPIRTPWVKTIPACHLKTVG